MSNPETNQTARFVRFVVVLLIVGLLAAGITWAASQGGARTGDFSVITVVVLGIFAVQVLAFIPAWLKQSEHFYDLVGSLTYIAAVTTALLLSSNTDATAVLLTAMVVIWAGRLGPFLFMRARKSGGDDRFDAIKPDFLRFLNVWLIQGLWVTITGAAAFTAITTSERPDLGVVTIIGVAIWLLGFGIEVVSDNQKSRFKADPANAGTFIRSGLWSRSRHPNYFGEIVLWLGVAVVAFPALSGWQYATLISPIFVIVLLTRVSGVPMLEKKADSKWGGQADYEHYKATTPVLIPSLTSKS